MPDLYELLDENQISFERHDHPPVFTIEDVERLVPELSAARTKNLFCRDAKGRRHFLVVVSADKRVDMKALPAVLGSSRLSFGSSRRLEKYLGVDPGAVSVFALLNDTDHAVEVVIDKSLWRSERFQFHPLVNTATLVISRPGLERFLAATGHDPSFVEVPSLSS
jgi:Ala-tRNA(Pro) deacylase